MLEGVYIRPVLRYCIVFRFDLSLAVINCFSGQEKYFIIIIHLEKLIYNQKITLFSYSVFKLVLFYMLELESSKLISYGINERAVTKVGSAVETAYIFFLWF